MRDNAAAGKESDKVESAVLCYIEKGKTAEVRELAGEMVEIFAPTTSTVKPWPPSSSSRPPPPSPPPRPIWPATSPPTSPVPAGTGVALDLLLNKALNSVSGISRSPPFLAGPIFVQTGTVVIKSVAHRVHRWKLRPRFRSPKTWIVLALLLLATLLVLPRVSTPPAGPPQLPTLPKSEPVLPIPPEASPTPASIETHERGCPKGCAEPPPGCDIKGNISQRTGERIYHLPGQRWYGKTVISPEDGEAWFCTEAEARENGWRKSKV